MLRSINLTLSAVCGANCIFCPSPMDQGVKQKIMPFEYAEKIINEVAGDSFFSDVKRVSVSEHGDCILNRDLIKILRFIKSKLPQANVVFLANFQSFTPDKIDIILGEKLAGEYGCNIDGSNPSNYYNVKRLDYHQTMKNLSYFLETRKRLNYYPKLTVWILTLHRYLHTIYNNFKFYPKKIQHLSQEEIKKLYQVPDDFEVIKGQLEKILHLPSDVIYKIRPMAWPERKQFLEMYGTKKIDYKKYNCHLLSAVPREAYIAPNGDWFVCCLDSNAEIVFGNVIKQSIKEVYQSEKRKRIIDMLKNKEFNKIGGPCRTVNCCQYLSKDRKEETILKIKRSLPKIKSNLKLILPDPVFEAIFKVYKSIKK